MRQSGLKILVVHLSLYLFPIIQAKYQENLNIVLPFDTLIDYHHNRFSVFTKKLLYIRPVIDDKNDFDLASYTDGTPKRKHVGHLGACSANLGQNMCN